MVGFRIKHKSKYGASKVVYQGETFDSKYELERYLYLKDLEVKGEISCLRRQTPFLLIKKTVRLVPKQLKTKMRWDKRVVEKEASYHNDFTYIENGKYISEELKSAITSKLPDYILRRKLMVRKIYEHNAEGHGHWIFREVIYFNKKKIVITDK